MELLKRFSVALEICTFVTFDLDMIASHMNRVLSFVLLVALVVVSNDNCHAYFHIAAEKHPAKVIPSHAGEKLLSHSHLILVPDNLAFHCHFNSNIADWPQVTKKHFFAMDIPIPDIVTQQRENYIPSEFNIENLVYANLKIARLIYEYNSLKKRSESILGNHNIPTGSWNSDYRLNHENNINGILQKMNQVNDQLMTISGMVLINSIKENIDNRTTNQINGQHSNDDQCQLNTLSFDYSSGWNYQDDNETNREDAPRPGIKGRNKDSKKDTGYVLKGNQSPPWVERFGQTLLDYIRENKIEVVFYLFMLFGAYRLLFRFGK